MIIKFERDEIDKQYWEEEIQGEEMPPSFIEFAKLIANRAIDQELDAMNDRGYKSFSRYLKEELGEDKDG